MPAASIGPGLQVIGDGLGLESSISRQVEDAAVEEHMEEALVNAAHFHLNTSYDIIVLISMPQKYSLSALPSTRI